MHKSKHFTALILAILMAFLAGCGSKLPAVKPYKMDIQQGNVITSKMLLKLRPGMTKSQVRYILGTPLIVDSFHPNRWDYFYELRKQGKVINKRRVILDFDQDALVVVKGDVVPQDQTKMAEAESTVLKTPKSVTPPKKEDKSWIDKLKFWKKGKAEVETKVATTDLPEAQVAETVADVTTSAAVVTAAVVDDAESVEMAEPESVLRQEIEVAPLEEVTPPPVMAIEKPVVEMIEPAAAVVEQAEAATPTPVVQPEPVKQVAVKAPVQMNDADAIKQAVNTWAGAWQNKNMDGYLGAYVPTYKGKGLRTRDAWIKQRKSRMSPRQGNISVVLEDVDVQIDGNKAAVYFYQKYKSKVYSDAVTKQLDMVLSKNTGEWLIWRERTIPDSKRPRVQKITAPENTNEYLDGAIEKIGF